jgi:hypothetical protein
MAKWPKTMAGEERRGVEEKKNTLTVRPGACLDGMAGQCPRGRPEATWGSLHLGTTGSTALGASTGNAHTPGPPQARIASTEWRSGGLWARRWQKPARTRAEIDASYAQVSAAEVTGDGQDLQATAAATLVAGESSRGSERRSERGRVGWAGLTDPDPSL